MFGSGILSNALHGPSTVESAAEEINLIFGDIEFDDRGESNVEDFKIKLNYNYCSAWYTSVGFVSARSLTR